MTIYKSNYNVFWKDNVNLPDLNLMEEINNSFSIYNGNVNYVNFYTLQIVTNDDLDISLLKFDDNNTIKYFHFISTEKILNGKRVYTFTLDIYLTYLISLLKKWRTDGTPFMLLRNPILDDSTIMFNDPLYDDIKYTGSFNFNKFWFKNIGLSDVFYWEYKNARITYPQSSQGDVVNGVMYAIFNSGDNGKYFYIPILSKRNKLYYESTTNLGTTSSIKCVTKDLKVGTYELNGNNYKFYDLKNNNVEISYDDFLNTINTYAPISKTTITCGDSNELLSNERNLSSSQIQSIVYSYTSRKVSERITEYKRIFSSNFSQDISSIWKSGTLSKDEKNLTYFIINFKNNDITTTWSRFEIGNSYENINNIKNSVEFSNKFLGIYFLPHVLFIADKTVLKTLQYTNPITSTKDNITFLMLDFQPEGNLILERELINDTLDYYVVPKKDNSSIDNWYLYKYLKAKYYNNDIDLSLYYSNNSFLTSGYFNFTGAGNYIDKLNQKSITECLWSYPYQLPSGTDGYLQYVSANYNSTNTSINVAKQQFALGAIGNIFGGVIGAGSAGLNPLSLVSSVGNSLISGISSGLGYANKMKMLKSQYLDAKNTAGTQIANSMLIDAAWINYYLKDEEQYSGLEMFYGNESFNKQINNIVYYYSYYSPRYLTMDDIFSFNSEWDNIFIQFDESDLDNKLVFELNNVEMDIKKVVFNMLTGGIRLWRKIPN